MNRLAWVVAWLDKARLTVEGIGIYSEPCPTSRTMMIPVELYGVSGATYEEAAAYAEAWGRKTYGARWDGLRGAGRVAP